MQASSLYWDPTQGYDYYEQPQYEEEVEEESESDSESETESESEEEQVQQAPPPKAPRKQPVPKKAAATKTPAKKTVAKKSHLKKAPPKQRKVVPKNASLTKQQIYTMYDALENQGYRRPREPKKKALARYMEEHGLVVSHRR